MKYILLIVAIFCFAACSEREVVDGKVTMLLNWLPEAEHGGYFAAAANGYFEEAGVEVEIQRGGVDVPVIQLVASGKATFGIANADDVLIGRSQGADIVALLAPIQESPRCILVRPGIGIDEPGELRNITLAMSSRAPFSQYLRDKLPLDGVEIVGYPGSVAPLVAGKIDAMQGYNFSEPFVAKQNGMDPVILMVSELGYNPYTSVLFTRGDVVREQPDLVAKVVSASKRGWEKYATDPAAANKLIHESNPEMTPEILEFGSAVLAPMVMTEEARDAGVGTMSEERWSVLLRQLEETGLVGKNSVRAEDAYTLRFLGE